MTCQDVAKVVGQRSLFLGVDTINWSIAQFQQAARFAKAHGFDSLLVKVADGGNRWYGSLAGWQNIKNAIHAEGVGAVPYTYSYGNTYAGIDIEINLLIEYMQDCGVVIMDAEVEWNGQVAWAQHLCSRMLPVKGTFLVSTWGNPDDQNWQGVIQALNPCVNSYLPQQYTNYLASCWQQYGAAGAACIMPTVMMTQDFGPNDPVAITRAAHSQGHAAMSVWYYDFATANPGLLDQIVAAFPVTATTPKPIQGGTSMTVPQGWHDSNNVLTAPNGITVLQGFRDYVLSHNWDPRNTPRKAAYGLNPLEVGNPKLGGGTRQSFEWTVLEWTTRNGVFECFAGQELEAVLDLLHSVQNTLTATINEKNKLVGENDALQKEIDQLKAQPTGTVEQQQEIVTLTQQVATLTSRVEAAATQIKTMYDKLTQINTLSKV
jgi:hypothetical protein